MVLGHRRALLASAYANQADVTVQMIADSSSTIPDTVLELNTSIANKTLLVSMLTGLCITQCWPQLYSN